MPLDWQLNTTVIALQGRAVADLPPADGQVLTWVNSAEAWQPADTSIPAGVYNYKGSVSDFGSLPSSDQQTGDTYYSTGDSTFYFWNGSAWVPLGPPTNTVSFPEAPTDGQIYGRDGSTTSWDPVLPLSGGILTGPIELAGDATTSLEPVTLQQMDNALSTLETELESLITSAAQFLGTLDAPAGEVFYTPQSGLTSGPLVPASQVPGAFVVCINAGTIPAGGPAGGTQLQVGDWLVSDGTNWIPINIAGSGAGAITSVVSGTGITVSTSNGVATVSLFTPVAIANGGTSATSASAALDALSGSAGSATGLLQRATNGVWSLVPGGGGGAVDATQVATNPTIDAWTTVQQALQGLYDAQSDLAPIDSPVFTGSPEAPNPAAGDSSEAIATTSWVNAAIAAYVSQWATESGVLTDVTTSGDVTSV